jgi:hypothetical protein
MSTWAAAVHGISIHAVSFTTRRRRPGPLCSCSWPPACIAPAALLAPRQEVGGGAEEGGPGAGGTDQRFAGIQELQGQEAPRSLRGPRRTGLSIDSPTAGDKALEYLEHVIIPIAPGGVDG